MGSNEPMRNECSVIYMKCFICDCPRENQQKGDDTGTRACHGTLSVTCTTAYAHI